MGVQKVVVAGLLTVVIAVCLAACGGSSSSGSSSSNSGSTTPEPAGESAGVTTAAGGKPAVEPKTIGLLPGGLETPAPLRWTEEMEQIGESLGWTVEVVDPKNNPQTMDQYMQKFVAEGVDAIFTQSLSASMIPTGLQEAHAKGIPVINIWTQVPPNESQEFTTEFVDGTEMFGELVGNYVAESPELSKTTVVSDNVASIFSAAGVIKGASRALEEAGLEISETKEDSLANLSGSAMEGAISMLEKNQGPVTFITCCSFTTPILQGAIEQLNRTNVTIIGQYDIASNVELAEAGKPVAFTVAETYLHGFEAVEAMMAYWFKNKPLPTKPKIDLPGGKVITKADLGPNFEGEYYPFAPALEQRVAQWESEYTLPSS
jgi:ABC-type sugar transport system substrate-binding protein